MSVGSLSGSEKRIKISFIVESPYPHPQKVSRWKKVEVQWNMYESQNGEVRTFFNWPSILIKSNSTLFCLSIKDYKKKYKK